MLSELYSISPGGRNFIQVFGTSGYQILLYNHICGHDIAQRVASENILRGGKENNSLVGKNTDLYLVDVEVEHHLK